MEIRHMRYFVALAEELHFGRAAERVNTDQSPFSRAIKELENSLSLRLVDRGHSRTTQLTSAGQAYLKEVRRILAAVDQAAHVAQAAASGHAGLLRVAASDGIAQPRLAALLALSREEDPSVDIRVLEVPLTEQLRGLRDGAFDVGFARCRDQEGDIRAYPLWQEDLVAIVPSRHPILAYSQIPLREIVKYPIIISNPQKCKEARRQLCRFIDTMKIQPNIVAEAISTEMTLTLVAAGYGIAFAPAEKVCLYRYPDVTTRPLEKSGFEVTTYLLVNSGEEAADRVTAFIRRAERVSHSNPHDS